MRSKLSNGEPTHIEIRGARTHNLAGIDLDLPRNKLIVVTGVSGSGKSSLAFDTIYAEGQRRYVESLSAYARQFMERLPPPPVDRIDGLSPALSIEQRTSSRNPRSTIATTTEIHDHLRLLFARLAVPHCVQCDRVLQGQTTEQMASACLNLGGQAVLLAPLVRRARGGQKQLLQSLRQAGYTRVRIDGHIERLEDLQALTPKKTHDVDLVVDRVRLTQKNRSRIEASIEDAVRRSQGSLLVLVDDTEHLFSRELSCPKCDLSFTPFEPRSFSFNTPEGACPACSGLGTRAHFDEDRMIDPNLSVLDGAIGPWKGQADWYRAILSGVCAHYKADISLPWQKLPKKVRKVILQGSGKVAIPIQLGESEGGYKYERPFEGLVPSLERKLAETNSEKVREQLAEFTTEQPCARCEGSRLKAASRHARLAGHRLAELYGQTIEELAATVSKLKLTPSEKHVAKVSLVDIEKRLGFLEQVGLGYLTLGRAMNTLSGGETQRIRLATQLGRALSGVLYVLDEPSIGLHPRDHDRLLGALFDLRDRGNTVLVVEHDEQTMRAADWIVDIGPGAGRFGGTVVAEGTPNELEKNSESLTGAYLSGSREIETQVAQLSTTKDSLHLKGAEGNNLKNLNIEFPLGKLICVSGVSGSGKSTLVHDTLYLALSRALGLKRQKPAAHKQLAGVEHIDQVVLVDQGPIGRTPRSNPATYTKVFQPIRDLFAQLPEAKLRGYSAGRFSFNVTGGRCEACEGDGHTRLAMHFLPDVFVRCEGCLGRRYGSETLDITYQDHSIADVLELSIIDALKLFEAQPNIRRRLQTLVDVGLGYLALGQSATTLSGGEAQRIKLARELGRKGRGQVVYLFDEPTTGLHFEDVRALIAVLRRLVDQGHTVIVIEHDLDMLAAADWLIDLGPEGGAAGGHIVAQGPPDKVALGEGHTARFLRPKLKPRKKKKSA